MATKILIRPAARGGKFLGPDAANKAGNSAIAAILDPITFEIINIDYVNATPPADAGPANLMSPISRSEPYATDTTTVNSILSVRIDVPTTFLIAVIGPLSYLDQARCTLSTITVLPGVDIGTTTNFPEGIVLEIPGLCISNVQSVLSGSQLSAFAQVTMMCGCKIGNALPYWPPSDFVIQLITKTESGTTYSYPMSFDTQAGILSSFNGNWTNQAPNDPIQTAWISASQPKLGNQGNYWIMDAPAVDSKLDVMTKIIRFLDPK
jgi:hypothetical protein